MQSKNTGYSWRKFNGDIHLWLGVASALVLMVVCVTGTMLIFWDETLRIADPAIYQVEAQGRKPWAVSEVIRKVEGENKGFRVSSVSIPSSASEAWGVSLSKKEKPGQKGKEKKKGRGRRGGKRLLVDQYTGTVQGNAETATSKFMSTTMYLHRFLLIDNVGKIIVGASTIIFIILEISGLILWLPKKIKGWKSWKPGFSIKWDANWKRINHDLHNTLGFYSLLLLLIMALTGLCWSFEWYRKGWNYVMQAELFAGRMEKPLESVYRHEVSTLLPEQFLEIGNKQLPYEANTILSLARDSAGAVSITKIKTGFFASAGTDNIVLDQYSGELLRANLFAEKTLGEQITALVYPLHAGSVFGTFSKIIYFIACLIAISLPVTGIIIWINKLNKKAKNKKQPLASKKVPGRSEQNKSSSRSPVVS